MTATIPPAARPTLADIARVAGVSHTTVSRALAGHRCSDKAKRDVHAAAQALGYTRRGRGPAAGQDPTPTRRAILALVAEGYPNAEIAAELHLALDTIKSHLRAAYSRLGARDRTHAAVLAIRRGLIPLDPAPRAAEGLSVREQLAAQAGRRVRLQLVNGAVVDCRVVGVGDAEVAVVVPPLDLSRRYRLADLQAVEKLC